MERTWMLSLLKNVESGHACSNKRKKSFWKETKGRGNKGKNEPVVEVEIPSGIWPWDVTVLDLVPSHSWRTEGNTSCHEGEWFRMGVPVLCDWAMKPWHTRGICFWPILMISSAIQTFTLLTQCICRLLSHTFLSPDLRASLFCFVLNGRD